MNPDKNWLKSIFTYNVKQAKPEIIIHVFGNSPDDSNLKVLDEFKEQVYQTACLASGGYYKFYIS